METITLLLFAAGITICLATVVMFLLEFFQYGLSDAVAALPGLLVGLILMVPMLGCWHFPTDVKVTTTEEPIYSVDGNYLHATGKYSDRWIIYTSSNDSEELKSKEVGSEASIKYEDKAYVEITETKNMFLIFSNTTKSTTIHIPRDKETD